MALPRQFANLPGWLSGTVAEAVGAERRVNPVSERTGGAAGNAKLTAWVGLLLLVLSLAEVVTLFDVRGLISWHVAIGALLGPPALLKTASTGWRVVRYYRRAPAYKQAGPPPLVLRLLGPLVVVSTFGLIATGVVLVLIGDQSSHRTWLTVVGLRLNWVTLHQVAFIAWAIVTGLHVLGRVVPALRISRGMDDGAATVPGGLLRLVTLLAATVLAIGAAVYLVRHVGTWGGPEQFGRIPPGSMPVHQ
jgi:hypothetical protein